MKVYNDRISVWNEGTLPEDFPVEMLLQEHSSRQRNPLIANVFFLAGFVETWGRGIKKIRRALQGVGLLIPSLRKTAAACESQSSAPVTSPTLAQ